jgi:hypothetical protein
MTTGNNVHVGLPDKEVLQVDRSHAELGDRVLEEPALYLLDLNVEWGHLIGWVAAVEFHAGGEERLPLEHLERDRLGEFNHHGNVVDALAEIRALDA